jgi:hypothetical protein
MAQERETKPGGLAFQQQSSKRRLRTRNPSGMMERTVTFGARDTAASWSQVESVRLRLDAAKSGGSSSYSTGKYPA